MSWNKSFILLLVCGGPEGQGRRNRNKTRKQILQKSSINFRRSPKNMALITKSSKSYNCTRRVKKSRCRNRSWSRIGYGAEAGSETVTEWNYRVANLMVVPVYFYCYFTSTLTLNTEISICCYFLLWNSFYEFRLCVDVVEIYSIFP